jgi:hypothetical protein
MYPINVQFFDEKPSEPGYYIHDGFMPEIVHIVRLENGELHNTIGRTHFSRWNYRWSKKLIFTGGKGDTPKS